MTSGLKVNIDRQLVCVSNHSGIEVEKATGLCYVDCFFPDGTQATVGYIGINPLPGSQFSPLAHCTQAVANVVQAEIDRQLGASATQPPQIIDTYDDTEDDTDEERDDDE